MLSKYTYWLIAVTGCIVLQACAPRRVSLTHKEQIFTDSLAEVLKGEVGLEHDFDVVDHNSKDKTAGLFIYNTRVFGFCEQDSAYLKKMSVALAVKLYRVLNYRSNYSHIEVCFRTYPEVEDSNNGKDCSKSVMVSTMPPYAIYVSEWYKSDGYNSQRRDTMRSDEIIEH